MDSQAEGYLRQSRDVEVAHYDNHDAIINLQYPNQDRIRALLAVVKDGIPKNWKPIYRLNFFGEKLTPADLFVDDDTKPSFFAKIKRRGSTASWFSESLRGIQNKRAEDDKRGKLTSRTIYASASLLNEFKIAREVKRALQSEEALTIAKNYGFARVELVEPLLGLINRITGVKTVFYEFINADTISRSRGASGVNKLKELQKSHQDITLLRRLEDMFKKNGIFPGDLKLPQLMVAKNVDSETFTLYLIDIEQYFHDPQGEFSQFPAKRY